jgi:ABC-type glycerol-3-phosphate transport system substrate-binding protein
MRNRIACMAVALALIAGAAWAAPKKQLVHYHWTETVYDPVYMDAVKAFQTAHPDVEVKLLLLPDSDRPNLIRTVLAAKGSIDSFSLTNGEAPEFLSAGQMMPISPAAFGKKTLDEVLKMWAPGSIEAVGGAWDGQYYGIPIELSNFVCWVNTAYMKEAGLNPATDKPKYWPDFVAVAKKMTKVQNGVTVRNGFMCNSKVGRFNFLILTTMMQQLGLDWTTEKGIVASMDKTDGLVRGLRTYTDFVVKDKIWDPALDDNDREGFGNGKAAMFMTGGTWYWGTLDTYSVPRKDVEPFPVPRFKDGKNVGGYGYGKALFVSKLCKEPDLAWQFLDVMTSAPNRFVAYGLYQPRLKLTDGSSGIDQALMAKSIPYFNEVFKGELANTAPVLASTKYMTVVDAVWSAISRVIYEGGAVEASVAGLQKDIRGIYK